MGSLHAQDVRGKEGSQVPPFRDRLGPAPNQVRDGRLDEASDGPGHVQRGCFLDSEFLERRYQVLWDEANGGQLFVEELDLGKVREAVEVRQAGFGLPKICELCFGSKCPWEKKGGWRGVGELFFRNRSAYVVPELFADFLSLRVRVAVEHVRSRFLDFSVVSFAKVAVLGGVGCLVVLFEGTFLREVDGFPVEFCDSVEAVSPEFEEKGRGSVVVCVFASDGCERELCVDLIEPADVSLSGFWFAALLAGFDYFLPVCVCKVFVWARGEEVPFVDEVDWVRGAGSWE